MARQTSIEAYNQIEQEGLLSRRRFLVYQCLFHNGPLTQGECSALLELAVYGRNGHQSITPRFAELKNRGVIIETGTRSCKITGRSCIEWDVTASLPIEYKRKTKDQIIRELEGRIRELEIEIKAMSESKIYGKSY